MPEPFETVSTALCRYGASLTEDRRIQRNGKTLEVSVVIKRNRLQFVSLTGAVLFSGAATSQAVEKFVESFWFWKKGSKS